MALIRSFVESSQNIRRHRTEVDCEHAVIGQGPERVLHLSTFGSDYRAGERKSSQSIQLDQDRAGELLTLIRRAFPELDAS